MLNKEDKHPFKIAFITITHNQDVPKQMRDQYCVDYLMSFLRKDKKGTIIHQVTPVVWQEGFFRKQTCYGFLIIYRRRSEEVKKRK